MALKNKTKSWQEKLKTAAISTGRFILDLVKVTVGAGLSTGTVGTNTTMVMYAQNKAAQNSSTLQALGSALAILNIILATGELAATALTRGKAVFKLVVHPEKFFRRSAKKKMAEAHPLLQSTSDTQKSTINTAASGRRKRRKKKKNQSNPNIPIENNTDTSQNQHSMTINSQTQSSHTNKKNKNQNPDVEKAAPNLKTTSNPKLAIAGVAGIAANALFFVLLSSYIGVLDTLRHMDKLDHEENRGLSFYGAFSLALSYLAFTGKKAFSILNSIDLEDEDNSVWLRMLGWAIHNPWDAFLVISFLVGQGLFGLLSGTDGIQEVNRETGMPVSDEGALIYGISNMGITIICMAYTKAASMAKNKPTPPPSVKHPLGRFAARIGDALTVANNGSNASKAFSGWLSFLTYRGVPEYPKLFLSALFGGLTSYQASDRFSGPDIKAECIYIGNAIGNKLFPFWDIKPIYMIFPLIISNEQSKTSVRYFIVEVLPPADCDAEVLNGKTALHVYHDQNVIASYWPYDDMSELPDVGEQYLTGTQEQLEFFLNKISDIDDQQTHSLLTQMQQDLADKKIMGPSPQATPIKSAQSDSQMTMPSIADSDSTSFITTPTAEYIAPSSQPYLVINTPTKAEKKAQRQWTLFQKTKEKIENKIDRQQNNAAQPRSSLNFVRQML